MQCFSSFFTSFIFSVSVVMCKCLNNLTISLLIIDSNGSFNSDGGVILNVGCSKYSTPRFGRYLYNVCVACSFDMLIVGPPRVVIRGEFYPIPYPLGTLPTSMVGPYGQPLGSGPLGRVFRAGALLLKRGGRSLQLLRRYAPTRII